MNPAHPWFTYEYGSALRSKVTPAHPWSTGSSHNRDYDHDTDELSQEINDTDELSQVINGTDELSQVINGATLHYRFKAPRLGLHDPIMIPSRSHPPLQLLVSTSN